MSSISNYDIGSTPALPGRNVVFNELRCVSADIPIVISADLTVDDLTVENNIDLSNGTGISGEIMLRSGADLVWSKLPDTSIIPGAAGTVMTTNGGGTTSQWSSNVSVNGTLSFNGVSGSANQYVKKSGGSQTWANIAASDITNGTANQILVTNSAGNASLWTSNIIPTSITFIADVNQTALSYYSEVLNTVLNITYEDDTTASVDVSLQRIGNHVSVRVDTRSVTYAAPPVRFYRKVDPIPSQFRPNYGTAVDYSDYHSECIPCEQSISGYVSGAGYIGLSGNIIIFTNVDRSVPAVGTLTSFTHTFNYMID